MIAPLSLPSPARCLSRRRIARGFSLVEVLVAIVVLSFGVLGVVGLQAASMQANSEARYQSAAVRFGRELADMMRDNKTTAMSTDPALNPYLIDYPTTDPVTPQVDCSAAVNGCPKVGAAPPYTNYNLAAFQVNDWLYRVKQELPGVRVVVCPDPAPYDANGVPQWSCPSTSGAVPAIPTLIVLKMGWTRISTNRSAAGASALDRASTPAVVLPLNPG